MRAAWLVVVALAVALVAQLSVLNGLHLPGGGVPDLVLVLVAALAMAAGPITGTVIGFVVGLCIDLAPPGSEVVGQYALVFCLAGWAAGKLRPVPGHSARHSAGLVATVLLGLVVAGAEVLSVALGKLLAPASVSLSQLRLALPSAIVYDWLLCPIVLSLVMLAGTVVAERSAAADLAPALAGTGRSRRAAKRARRLPELRLGREARKAGDGWLSISRPADQLAVRAPGRAPARLRPAAGVPGSASGLRHRDGRLPAGAPVHLRLARGRPGDRVIGTSVRHPGTLAASGRTFRPRGGEPGGSAARSYHLTKAVPAQRQARIRFGGHQPSVLSAGPQLRMGARRSAVGSATVPSLTFARASAVPPPRRAVASPRFRRGSSLLSTGRPAADMISSSAPTQSPPRARRQLASPRLHLSSAQPGMLGGSGGSPMRARRQQASPRLRLSGTPPGMLGGSGRSLLRARPPGRPRKQPRFSYGKRSPLSFLTTGRKGRGRGGRWLTRRRAGTRSAVWLIGRRGGGLR